MVTRAGGLEDVVAADTAITCVDGVRGELRYRGYIELTTWIPTAVAALHRRRAGLEPVAPREDLDTAASFLWMLRGEAPDSTTLHSRVRRL